MRPDAREEQQLSARSGVLRASRVAKAPPPHRSPFYWVRAARSGGGPKAQRAGPAVLRTAKARPIRPRPVCSRRQRRAATSAGELQSAAWGGGELRDSASRRSSANSSAQSTARRTSTAQSVPQFSAPCQPHCGSAVAPPRLPSPAAILAGLAHRQPAEYALLSGRATDFTREGRVFSRACAIHLYSATAEIAESLF